MSFSKVKLKDALYSIITDAKKDMFDKLSAQRTNHLTVAVENIYQEHNASAVMRTCDCFGVRDLHIIEKTNKFTIQRDIAMGAGRWVQHYHYQDSIDATKMCISSLKNNGYKIIATSPHQKSKSIYDIGIDQPIALIFGTEKAGLSKKALEMADETVYIPVYGFTESYNISVSAALCLQILRHRLESQKEIAWLLSEEEQLDLKINWCKKIIKNPEIIEKEFISRIEMGLPIG